MWNGWEMEGWDDCHAVPTEILWLTSGGFLAGCIEIPVTCGPVPTDDPKYIANDGRPECQPFFNGELAPCDAGNP
jgi:hypothetical protein